MRQDAVETPVDRRRRRGRRERRRLAEKAEVGPRQGVQPPAVGFRAVEAAGHHVDRRAGEQRAGVARRKREGLVEQAEGAGEIVLVLARGGRQEQRLGVRRGEMRPQEAERGADQARVLRPAAFVDQPARRGLRRRGSSGFARASRRRARSSGEKARPEPPSVATTRSSSSVGAGPGRARAPPAPASARATAIATAAARACTARAAMRRRRGAAPGSSPPSRRSRSLRRAPRSHRAAAGPPMPTPSRRARSGGCRPGRRRRRRSRRPGPAPAGRCRGRRRGRRQRRASRSPGSGWGPPPRGRFRRGPRRRGRGAARSRRRHSVVPSASPAASPTASGSSGAREGRLWPSSSPMPSRSRRCCQAKNGWSAPA